MKLEKIIIAPDSFKGSLSASEATNIIAETIKTQLPNCELVLLPLADGGEGSSETIITALGGNFIQVMVIGPSGELIKATYGISNNQTAIIEMAQSSGLTRQNKLHPLSSNTFGLGQLILDALNRGIKDFVLAIGGSATTDGGCGMAAALGVKFLNQNNEVFIPNGGSLKEIAAIDFSEIDQRIQNSGFKVLCDVDNPLYGPQGAAYQYAAQKGADKNGIELLDQGLINLAKCLKTELNQDYSKVAGGGAAGGLGVGSLAFLKAQLLKGSEVIPDLVDFSLHLKDCDLIITGEGKLDSQSFNGKVLSGIMRLSPNIPICCLCGLNEAQMLLKKQSQVHAFAFPLDITLKESINNASKYLALSTLSAIQYYKQY